MRRLRRRVARCHLRVLLVCSALAGAGLTLAGCAASSAADRVPTAVQVGRADMEADGLPAQVPPRASLRQQPVDPSEPYSPHYGSLPSHRATAARRLSSTEQEAIIAEAITAHEMRRP